MGYNTHFKLHIHFAAVLLMMILLFACTGCGPNEDLPAEGSIITTENSAGQAAKIKVLEKTKQK